MKHCKIIDRWIKARFTLGDFVRATRSEAKTKIQHRDRLKLAGEKIRREQVGTVPTFLSVRASKFAKWKTVLSMILYQSSFSVRLLNRY